MKRRSETVAKANLVDQGGFLWQEVRGRDQLICPRDGSRIFQLRVRDDDSLGVHCGVCGEETIRLDVWEQA